MGTAVAGVFVAACDFPHPGNPHPPTDAGASDAQPPPDAADAAPDAAPLPECLPPCLREALSRCLPALDSCFSEREPADAVFPYPYSDKICAAGSSWSLETANTYNSIIKTITQNGTACFRAEMTWGSGYGPWVRYFDSSGAVIAGGTSSTSGDGQVYCTSGTPDVSYPLTSDCPLPMHRCQATTPGNCP
ncbi:MAG TPA: hypothetical protein VI072_21455 [Polyangiaceae bacterium]